MSRFKIEAFVIRTTRMAESSRVVTLYSREVGKVKAVAKGVGRPKSKMAGSIELFNLIEGVLYKKETSDLGTLSSASVLQDFKEMVADSRKFGFGSAWCGILDKDHRYGTFFRRSPYLYFRILKFDNVIIEKYFRL